MVSSDDFLPVPRKQSISRHTAKSKLRNHTICRFRQERYAKDILNSVFFEKESMKLSGEGDLN